MHVLQDKLAALQIALDEEIGDGQVVPNNDAFAASTYGSFR